MKAEFDVTGAGVTTKTLAKSLLRTANVGFSDGAIRGIGIANVYNNRQTEDPRQVTGPMVRWRAFQAAPPVADATEALASRIEPQGAGG